MSTRKIEQEDSLDAQRDRAAAFASKNGFGLRIFSEQASAKTIAGRPVLQQLVAELKELPARQRPGCLYVTALDRLFRDLIDGTHIAHLLREKNVALIVEGHGEYKLHTFDDRALFVGESLGGDAENEARSNRLRDSWDRRRRQGKPMSNKRPYGLMLVAELDVAIPESAEWVRMAFQWYADGIGAHVIGKRMSAGAPPHTWLTRRIAEDGSRVRKSRQATDWEPNRVMKLLRCASYREIVVEPTLFDAVQLKIASIRQSSNARIHEYPLSGSMRCSACSRHLHGGASSKTATKRLADGSVTTYQKRRNTYYRCVICNYSINAAVVERVFFAMIGALKADDRLLERWLRTAQVDRNPSAAQRRELSRLIFEVDASRTEQRRNGLFDLAVATSLSERDFKFQLDRLNREVSQKLVRIDRLKELLSVNEVHARNVDRAKSLLNDFQVLYGASRYEIKRELLSTLSDAVGGVTISKAGLQIGLGFSKF